MRNLFPKRTLGAPLHTLSKLYDVSVGFVFPSLEAVYCYICRRRRVAVARYRMIFLVLTYTIKRATYVKDALSKHTFNVRLTHGKRMNRIIYFYLNISRYF